VVSIENNLVYEKRQFEIFNLVTLKNFKGLFLKYIFDVQRDFQMQRQGLLIITISQNGPIFQ
jgi:hypothetical protein